MIAAKQSAARAIFAMVALACLATTPAHRAIKTEDVPATVRAGPSSPRAPKDTASYAGSHASVGSDRQRTGAPGRVATIEASEMIDGGLRFLSGAQNADGSFGGSDSNPVRVAVTALATLAFLAHGDTEYRGTWHREVERAVKWLMGASITEGDRTGYITTNGDTKSRMHGHAYATLALTQAYGMFGVKRRYASTTDDMKKTIVAAVDVIVRSQSRVGGWFYEPFDIANDEGSMTVCMIQALRAARDAGLFVPKGVIEKATEYIHRSQNNDGSFRYRLFGDTQTSFELACAACSTLIHAGEYYDKSMRIARDWIWGLKFDAFISGTPQGYPYYGLFYAVQALWFDYDHDRMGRNYPRIVAWFAKYYDSKTGVYRHLELPAHSEMVFGDAYRTAMATLTLQIADGHLPIFQR